MEVYKIIKPRNALKDNIRGKNPRMPNLKTKIPEKVQPQIRIVNIKTINTNVIEHDTLQLNYLSKIIFKGQRVASRQSNIDPFTKA
ncbi:MULTISPECIES: hypothetical protein [unclassified Saccharicrinis]|uniref:hypothetical protein n=1 Tax=unclassified Saccharicrinis TaxID=2646859 RepID=UPI003D3489ED